LEAKGVEGGQQIGPEALVSRKRGSIGEGYHQEDI
jgi:hypothetical protein